MKNNENINSNQTRYFGTFTDIVMQDAAVLATITEAPKVAKGLINNFAPKSIQCAVDQKYDFIKNSCTQRFPRTTAKLNRLTTPKGAVAISAVLLGYQMYNHIPHIKYRVDSLAEFVTETAQVTAEKFQKTEQPADDTPKIRS